MSFLRISVSAGQGTNSPLFNSLCVCACVCVHKINCGATKQELPRFSLQIALIQKCSAVDVRISAWRSAEPQTTGVFLFSSPILAAGLFHKPLLSNGAENRILLNPCPGTVSRNRYECSSLNELLNVPLRYAKHMEGLLELQKVNGHQF